MDIRADMSTSGERPQRLEAASDVLAGPVLFWTADDYRWCYTKVGWVVNDAGERVIEGNGKS